MLNSILSICWIFLFSLSSCNKEKTTEKSVQVEKVYTLISKVYEEKGKKYIDADYVQYFEGEKAIDEAKKRGEADTRIENGQTVYSVPDDVYIVNENNKIRKLELSTNVNFDLLDFKGSNEAFTHFKSDYNDKLYQLTIEGNEVLGIKEVFTP